ncbi:hypothetical protein CHH28_12190 [Bacterioplanes sanyensis]|uniref:Uncharacterized protein n=1 Tax=Bacterioplanes sanyensis TaxID=1249553 RepID=A0A222FLI9_9GAMM|nr:hypothetical protein [Bacterioplanes sanyensis]ASP39384.1 hypothetical protein CHH28_12190 [Bacterioplanes sanyensis]
MSQDISMTQSLLDRYYQEEKERQERDLSLASVQVRLDASDLAMLSGIAKRFQKTRDEVASELLSSALLDIFSRLEAGERKLLARDSDEAARLLADEIAEENGVHSIEFKSGVWSNHERQIVKQERKRARQQSELAKPANNSEPAAPASSTPAQATAEPQSPQPQADTEQVSQDAAPEVAAHANNDSADSTSPESVFGS